ncbi:hypothetical protein KPSB59_1960002 [Klebsiella quasipneumoniae subsp. quasipneumoniae]|nr:hypothetical protein KPSB59_1960002 [Klebsiella quasipneumoniae subsp. quasipneumoniae]
MWFSKISPEWVKDPQSQAMYKKSDVYLLPHPLPAANMRPRCHHNIAFVAQLVRAPP